MNRTAGTARIALDLWRAQREGEAGLARRRERRLAALLEHAWTASPFYRRLYGERPVGNAALAGLPVVGKRQLMAAFDDWVTDRRVTRADVEAFVSDPSRVGALYRGELFACTSSGTTGHPGLFLHDAHALAVYRAIVAVRIDLAWMTIWQWLRMARRGLRWASVLGTGGHFAGAAWVELERRRSRWKSRAYRVFSVQSALAELVAGLDAFDPTILVAYPSALELLAEEQAAGRLHLRPILTEVAGETMTPDSGARMAAAFGCAIRNAYGASEFPFFALSCDHDWLHVCSDWIVLEPVDETYDPTPPGEPSHTVLVTNLANRIQPIIRYDLGDSVLVRADPCPCGSRLPAIRVAGRRDDVLRLRADDGSVVNVLPLAIGAVLEELPGLRRGQIVQTGPASLRVRLEPERGADAESPWRAAAAGLGAYLARQGLSNVELVRASEPPEQNASGGKFRQVIAARTA